MAPKEPHKTASDKTSPVASTTLSSSVFNWRLCPFTASLTPLKSMWTTVGWSASDEAHRFAIELELAKAATPKRARLNLTRMCTFSHRSLRMQMAT